MKTRNKMRFLVLSAVAILGIVLWTHRKSQVTLQPTVGTQIKHPAVAPVAASKQNPTNDRRTVVIPQRKFIAMGVLEANAILVEIGKMDLASIFRVMIDAGRVEHDVTKQLSIQSTLVGSLRVRTPSLEFLAQMRAFIADSSNSTFERNLVFGVLGAASTVETVDLLIEVATTSPDTELRQTAISTLNGVGTGLGSGEKLSPALDRVWRDSQDKDLLRIAAIAMAQVGASSSVNMLLESSLEENGRDETRARAAQGAFAYVTILNPNAVPPLAARLENQLPSSTASKLAADTLVKMGIPAAGRVLVEWLRNADENAAPLAVNYVMRSRTETMLAQWEAALSPAVSFKSEKNREAVRSGLIRYRQSIR